MDRRGDCAADEGGARLIDKDAFCAQIRRCERAMYALAFSLTRNDADAADVIGEAICRAYKNCGTLRDEKAFKAWVLQIVHHTAVEYIRKNAHTLPIEDADAVGMDGGSGIDTAVSLRMAVERLKQPYRTAVVLYYYEDMSVAGIARITKTSTAAVKKQLSRAREQLRESLKEDFRDA